jgi:hypothetical protein
MEFEQIIDWENKHKLCKLGATKKGNYLGEFNKMFKLMIMKEHNKFDNKDEIVAYLVPVKYKKVGGQQPTQEENVQKIFGQQQPQQQSDEKIPF